MRARILILLSCFVLCGCRTMAWYQPGKSCWQASRDCEECRYEVMKYSNPFASPQSMEGVFLGQETELLMQCMKLRGYALTDVTERVKAGQLRIHQEGMDPYYVVAGE